MAAFLTMEQIEEMIEKSMSKAVSKAVDEAVSKAVSKAVDEAVSKAVSEAVAPVVTELRTFSGRVETLSGEMRQLSNKVGVLTAKQHNSLAPQRERVSRATIPSGRPGDQPRTRTRRWKSLIRPDVNMGVPQLMMILEPNIVWEHTKGFVPGVGRDVEANVTPGEFFEGWHKGGRRVSAIRLTD
ncbi:hypothetical protein VOLCADRAFT_105249 [Volvox carteri f. nagariensis]|uniref:Uncharacterized protein n=1 Tax=Volvox carteri f. nagariensis TaxID=3068 RepID=D8TZK6_VOLCA|nr:uncharacterized protein VOLCADRAFT_105249 [Volvox carteri f. nagariensis]EFJ46943.1 hypothetical protein VOLCADRAFT_105249 [Volvox carteri f. nagariensis]|eukprot:XP_002951838.1 hypothetical protein VOLCADRAFT_105249 [Volvox carteri f. nagariensis]